MSFVKLDLDKVKEKNPEEYDVIFNGERVGVISLSNGQLHVTCPDKSGKKVFHAFPNGQETFTFDERNFYLERSKQLIRDWMLDSGIISSDEGEYND